MKIEKIWTTDDAVWVVASNGKKACERFDEYPRLRYATAEQRNNYVADDFGIHWPDIDEDLSFEGFFEQKHPTQLYRFFMSHPELNAAAVARRMNMKQSLLAAYISGAKKPSEKRKNEIVATIREIGKELAEAEI